MKRFLLELLFFFAVLTLRAADPGITCEGEYPAHLQGIAADREAIYWSFTASLVKTDFTGKVLKAVSVVRHHGDLCVHDGKVYVAVNLTAFNRPCPPGKNFVYEYQASDLSFIRRHPVDEMIYGAGGIEFANGSFYVVGGLPDTEKENLVCEYAPDFKFKRKILLPGWTKRGIQTACFVQDKWFFGIYGKGGLKVCDMQFRELKPAKTKSTSLGMTVMPDGKIAVGFAKRVSAQGEKPQRNSGWIRCFKLLPDGSLVPEK